MADSQALAIASASITRTLWIAQWHQLTSVILVERLHLLQGHVQLLQYLQASCPDAIAQRNNKGLTADEMLAR